MTCKRTAAPVSRLLVPVCPRLRPLAAALLLAFPPLAPAEPADALPELAGRKGGPAYNVSAGGNGATLDRRDADSRLSLHLENSQRTGSAVGVNGGLAFGDALALGGGLVLGADKRDVYANLGWAFSPAQRLMLTGGQLRQNLDFDFPSGRARADLVQNGGGLSYRMTLTSGALDHLELNAYRAFADSRDLGAVNYAIDTAALYELWLDPRRVAGGSLAGVQGRAGLVPWSGGSLDLGLGRERLRYDERAGADSQTRTTARFEIAQAVSAATRIKFAADAGAAQTRYTTGFDVAFEGGRLGITLDASRGRNGAPDDRRLQVSWTLPLTRVARTAMAPGGRAASGALLDQIALRPSWLPAQVLARIDTSVAPTRLIAVDKTTVPAGATVDKTTGAVSAPLGIAAGSIAGITRNGAPFANAGQFVLSGGAIVVNTALIEQPAVGVRDTYVVTVANADGGTTLITIVVARGSVRVESISVAVIQPAPAASADDTNNLIVLGAGAVAANLEVSVDGGAYAAYGATTTYAGNHTVKVRVKAMSGNPAGAETTLTFTEVTPAAPAASADDTNNVIVLGAGAVAANLEVAVDGGAYAAYSASATYAGNHTVKLRAKAMNGNPAGAETTLSFTEVAPAAPAVSADDTNNVIVLGSGVVAANLEVSVDGGAYAAYSAATTYAGNRTVKVRVKAMNGNPAGAATALSFTEVAPAAPAVTANDDSDVIVLGSGVVGANLEVSVDGGAYAAYSAATTYAGSRTVKVRVKAMNGNPAGVETTLSFTTPAPATTPPVMGNVPDQPALAVNTAYALALAGYVTQTDGNAITGYRIASGSLPNGLALNAGTGAITGTPTLAGGYTVTVQAQDADGWSNADQAVFTVAAAPNNASSFSSVPGAQSVNQSGSLANLTITTADSDAGAKQTVTIVATTGTISVTNANGGAIAGNNTNSVTITNADPGNIVYTFNAPGSGNSATVNYTVTDGIQGAAASASTTITLNDVTAPNAPTLTTTPQYTNQNSVSVEVNGEVGSSVWVNGVNTELTVAGNGKVSVPLNTSGVDGLKNFAITLKDSSPNANQSGALNVSIDKSVVAPASATIISMAIDSKVTNYGNVTIQGDLSFAGATGLTVASRNGGTVLGVSIDGSGNIVIASYDTPNVNPDYLDITGTDKYGNPFSIARRVDLPN